MQKMALSFETLENAALCARKCGRPEAVRDLADLVESIGSAPLSKPMKTKAARTGTGRIGGEALARRSADEIA